MMTLDDLFLTEGQWKDVWCDLNVFRWPDLWPEELKPAWWLSEDYSPVKQNFIRPFMRKIEASIPMHKILERWREQHPSAVVQV